jgi:hypothetical protein
LEVISPAGSDPILYMRFESYQKSYSYDVKYVTVLDVLAYVGGLFNIFLAIFVFMTKYG